ncbi:MAG TPA: hypothetical protein VM818_00545 [Vicinamibacterales bacterium]|nr:hypothetical protein [Vicinamibacterales bacterium]
MFLGHFALSLGAKRAVPSVSLGALILAGQFADLLWPMLVLAGMERVEIQPGATVVTPLDFVSYPYSHSLAALVAWGLLVALAYRLATRATAAASLMLVLLVVSHWVLDVIAHRPDMPLTPRGTTRLGFGLWNSLPATLLVEGLLFVAGTALYLRTTTARDRVGSAGLWSLLAFLAVTYAAAVFGPPPPSPRAVVVPATAMWLLILWAYWVDGHRTARC